MNSKSPELDLLRATRCCSHKIIFSLTDWPNYRKNSLNGRRQTHSADRTGYAAPRRFIGRHTVEPSCRLVCLSSGALLASWILWYNLHWLCGCSIPVHLKAQCTSTSTVWKCKSGVSPEKSHTSAFWVWKVKSHIKRVTASLGTTTLRSAFNWTHVCFWQISAPKYKR